MFIKRAIKELSFQVKYFLALGSCLFVCLSTTMSGLIWGQKEAADVDRTFLRA